MAPYTSYWLNEGRAWMAPASRWPPAWELTLPRSKDSAATTIVQDLDEALEQVRTHGLRLEVDDWTYVQMVRRGCAPPVRPPEVLRPPGGTLSPGPPVDEREATWEAVEYASVLVGLPPQEAQRKAAELKLTIVDPTEPVTLAFCRTRVRLFLTNDVVVAVEVG